ncbi:uncharacterized protein [Miscanthus floridulus]|uniref:uncharacterized protein isoform X2 n=1 Tax=Miscanthus floridulus TaxID=154761 RepID=UPI00345812C2
MDGGNREDFAHDSWGGKLEDSRRVVDSALDKGPAPLDSVARGFVSGLRSLVNLHAARFQITVNLAADCEPTLMKIQKEAWLSSSNCDLGRWRSGSRHMTGYTQSFKRFCTKRSNFVFFIRVE